MLIGYRIRTQTLTFIGIQGLRIRIRVKSIRIQFPDADPYPTLSKQDIQSWIQLEYDSDSYPILAEFFRSPT